ncbi:hypothetical protein [Streptomyces sp. NPDC048338]|uniref:hypothetical protein n=1 Tax=Streptomyces sp. NPDC048338 TaxID=3365536 RepID=UPI0037189D2D
MPATLDTSRAPAPAGLTAAPSAGASPACLPARGAVGAGGAPRTGATREAGRVGVDRAPHGTRPDAVTRGGILAGISRPGRRTAVVTGFLDCRACRA